MKINATKFVSCLAVCLSLVVLLTFPRDASSRAQDRRNFWVLNNTGKKISRFYISPHERTGWGQDFLGQGELPNSLGARIYFNSNVSSSCVMDSSWCSTTEASNYTSREETSANSGPFNSIEQTRSD